ncbi:PREDICTED: chitin elicitor receptor kinase 1 [Tarenaya hassleriana]|uniref:chitin elicitor receptor kinase 1 n=1 Tax=Tarenaya hassleriana TaxID=28532 RepID=UPI00053C60DA|nr:PREDICTED: chitin elicitor receptor kinase 1 [Tarenaya hassleriana]
MMFPRFKGLGFLLVPFLLSPYLFFAAESKCRASCDFALASYYAWNGSSLTVINQALDSPIAPFDGINFDPILRYNSEIKNKDLIQIGSRILVPFPCQCLPGDFLGYTFTYRVRREDTYDAVARVRYANLTTTELLRSTNSYPDTNIPDTGTLNVTVNCSCGDGAVSKDYGLFVTYPLRPEDSLSSIARSSGVPAETLQRYNPNVDFNAGTGIVYVPGKDPNGAFPPFKSSKKAGSNAGVIAGICIGVAVALTLAAFLVYGIYRKRKSKGSLSRKEVTKSVHNVLYSVLVSASSVQDSGRSLGIAAITVDKSVEFSYEELARATDNFSMAYKIGEGGFGAVYYAELRGEKAAVKKMQMGDAKQFLAELKVLTRVHHVNLVRLIGYCTEGSLFLVYEYIENGNIAQHLRGSERDPLPWTKRVQIALDSARGLEYIHEHTVPVYIHRDIKSENILIDRNFRAKVADFGLAKLTEVGGTMTRGAMGTFGYMPPEAVYGDVSAKGDVYAFGVVLYELISAKPAVVKLSGTDSEFKGLVGLFEEVFNQPDPKEALRKIIDPRLGDDYVIESVYKMAELARASTRENAQLRPSMRYVVVALTTLSSSTGNWEVGNFENEDLLSLMSGR